MSTHPLNRRRFLESLGAAGLGLGYSIAVRADDLAPVPLLEEQPAADAIRERIDPLSGGDAPRHARHDTHLRRVDLACDFLVAGGGLAGVCAALAAARNGATVILVQDRSRLGGNASSEVRMHPVGADRHGSRPGWREGGILEEIRLDNAARNPDLHWEMWDLLLYDKVVSEPNIRLLLDTAVVAAEVRNEHIRSVTARSDKTEHLYQITARYYADCTGDCRLGLEAGARTRTGHEARAEFGEPLAPETAGTGTLGSSILFTAKDHGAPRPFKAPAWARKIQRRHLKHRGIRSWEYGYWWIEWGGNRDAIHDNERIRFELLAIVLGTWDYIKNSGDFPESANWAMDWIGMVPGKRASRRLEGAHLLTQQDCMGLNGEFADAVAIGGWSFDNHPPIGFDDPDTPPFTSIPIDEVYNIPLRSLYSANVANLFMAGRNISASHVAFTSTRVMATCAVLGQAVGRAAAYCAEHKLLPGALAADATHLARYRQALLRDDQTIKNLRNEDPGDLARIARVSASAALPGAPPENVINGWVRNPKGGLENLWAAPLDGGPATLELRWDTPVSLRQVQLTFDSGFSRQLTQTEQQEQRAKMILGPQPETVREYTLATCDPTGTWHDIAHIPDNHQRLRRHELPATPITALRVTLQATHGVPEARVFEVRCYA